MIWWSLALQPVSTLFAASSLPFMSEVYKLVPAPGAVRGSDLHFGPAESAAPVASAETDAAQETGMRHGNREYQRPVYPPSYKAPPFLGCDEGGHEPG